MNKLLLFSPIILICFFTQAQQFAPKKKPSLAVSFILNDFSTAAAIKRTSLSSVLKYDEVTALKDMKPGVAISYYQGLSSHVDFMASIGGSFLRYPYKKNNVPLNDGFLLELDASINVKLLSDNYGVVPFLSGGIGASLYQPYFGAYIPLGGGVQVNLSSSSFLFTQVQYRIGITERTTDHLNFSLGFSSPLFDK